MKEMLSDQFSWEELMKAEEIHRLVHKCADPRSASIIKTHGTTGELDDSEINTQQLLNVKTVNSKTTYGVKPYLYAINMCGGAQPEIATLGGATGRTTTSGGGRGSHLTWVISILFVHDGLLVVQFGDGNVTGNATRHMESPR
ncbi:hypothetical protein Sjap_014647 [Stephania japonica]|uniref:Uncharacterized protein n=1 Tax=Stephania japonica TaxID=461633 RepID=A0AAP0II35_9MAGN